MELESPKVLPGVSAGCEANLDVRLACPRWVAQPSRSEFDGARDHTRAGKLAVEIWRVSCDLKGSNFIPKQQARPRGCSECHWPCRGGVGASATRGSRPGPHRTAKPRARYRKPLHTRQLQTAAPPSACPERLPRLH